jgi:lipopolysaccharide export LptBFGC system permease protein LptF
MYKIISNIWTAVLWTAVIFLLLGLNNENVPDVGLFNLRFKDKIYHFLVFAIFSFLWSCYSVRHPETNNFNLSILIFVIGSLYGIGMEFFQDAFTNRQFSWWDGLADVLGTATGLLLAKKSPYGNRGRNQN